MTFFADEWEVIAARPLGLDSFLTPFNEHWLGIQVTVFRALVEAIGLGSYMPYLALLVLLHAVVALEVYVIARRATQPWIAAAVTLVVLLFGSGFEDLFWAMQIGFVGAIALGFGALLLLDGRPTRGRVVAATILLVLAIMTSGFGLFMLALVGLDLLVDPARRRLVPVTFVPAGIWLVWYLALGRAGVAAHGSPFTADAIVNVPSFVLGGLTTAFGAALGVGEAGGLIAVAATAALLVIALVRRIVVPRRTIALLGAIVAMYILLGLVRSNLGIEAQYYTRYTYLSGILALLALATAIGRRPMPEAPRLRLLAVGAVGLVITLSLLWNVRLLLSGRDLFLQRADLGTRALVALATTEPLPPGVDPSVDLVLIPSPDRVRAIVARFGSPLSDSLAGDAVLADPRGGQADALKRALDPPDFVLAGCIGSRPLPADCARFEGG